VKRLFRLLNMLVVGLSETPVHRLFSHQVLVLRFAGRRSGRGYAIPVSFLLIAHDESRALHCMTDIKGVWWRNLVDAGDIEVTWQGQRRQVSVEVVSAEPEAIRNALGAFCRASAISAFFAGVKMVQGAPDPTTLEQAAAEHVLIRLGL